MASNSATVQGGPASANQGGPGHFQQPNSAHHCKECGLFFDSAKSLEVHLQYHKENLLNKWATQAAQGHPTNTPDQETNNNNNPAAAKQQQQPPIKREFSMSSGGSGTIAAPADSSDSMLVKSSNKSPDSYNSRTTPETSSTSFGHPPTPQSYHSAPSPYQNHADGNTNFSPSYQQQQQQGQYQPVAPKSERASPSLYGPGGGYLPQHMYGAEQQHAQQQYFNMEQQQQQQQQQQLGYPQDYPVHKIPSSQSTSSFRYHPYGHHPSAYERSPQVSSSSPAYPSHNSQPTPSPSPKQCDKCGFVCDSAAQLIDHLNHAHPPTPSPANHLPPYQQQFAAFADSKPPQGTAGGGDDEPQTEILDLDSHKVHHVFQSPEEEEEMKRNGELAHGNPHSVSAMLGSWPNTGTSPTHKMYSPGPLAPDHRAMFHSGPQPDQKPPPMFQHPGMHPNEYIVQAGVTTSSQEPNTNMMAPMGQYRPFEHLPPQPNPPVISSTQLSGGGNAGAPAPVCPPKGANWKSNEARRPKTYNCSACNKWFTSSGHLKRHYNTTLHKNAVKSSGQPDPATLPISAHHHPGRVEDNTRSGRGGGGGGMQGDQSNHSPDSADDVNARTQEDMSPASMYDRTGGMLQQPPSGPYDRQPAMNLGPGPPLPGMHSPGMHGGSPGLQSAPSLTNLSSGSPPNGEAGPSASHQDHLSRGLLSISTVSQQQHNHNSHSSVTGQQMECTSQAGSGFNLYPGAVAVSHHMSMSGTQPLHSPLQDTISSSTGSPFHQSMQQPQAHHLTMASHQSYPNESAPHVTPATATNSQLPASTSLTIIGDEYGAETLYGLVGQQQYEQTGEEQQQPLPSFAQFQSAHHRYGILLAAPSVFQANVGGGGPATDPIYHPHTLATALLQHHLPPQQGDASPYAAGEPLSPAHYQDITVLESAAQAHLLPSPTDFQQTAVHQIKLEPKSDYEHGSPQITSTGSPVGTVSNTPEDGRPKGPVEHKCYDCKKVFNKACYLTQHNKTFHSGHRPFKCHRCGKRFASDSVYQEHLAKHAGDKPYKCELCPKQFNHKTDLRRHMCLHTGQKPYACEHCGKGFIRKDHMLKHTETHTRKSHQKAAAAAAHQLQAAS